MLDVTLEVPLGRLALAGLLQRDHARTARVEVFVEAFDGATLAGGVAALEDQQVPLPGLLGPLLQFEQFDLQTTFGDLVLAPAHALGVRIVLAPGVDDVAVGQRQQDRVVVIVVVDRELRDVVQVDELLKCLPAVQDTEVRPMWGGSASWRSVTIPR